MSKVKIYTLANITPELLYKQYESMKKFIKDEDWEFIVLNNTPIIAFDRRKRIKNICKELNLKCKDVRFRSFVSGASYIAGWSLTWAYHRFCRWEKDTIHVIIDSDMFFINDFNFNDYLGDNDVVGIHQRRGKVDYLWNGLFFMRGGEIPDKNRFNLKLTTFEGERTDVGGSTYYWLKRNPNLKIKFIQHTCHNDVSKSELIPEKLRSDYKPEFNFQFLEDFILHYRGASNWSKSSDEFVNAKKNYFNKFMDEILNNNVKINPAPELYICKE
jgi:hypothetical protein